MKSALASSLGVDVAQISITIAAVPVATRRALSTASVTITVSIKAASVAQTTSLNTQVDIFLGSTTSATSMFGSTVTVASVVSTGVTYPPSPPVAPPPTAPDGNATTGNVSTSSPPSAPVTVIYQNDNSVPGWAI